MTAHIASEVTIEYKREGGISIAVDGEELPWFLTDDPIVIEVSRTDVTIVRFNLMVDRTVTIIDNRASS